MNNIKKLLVIFLNLVLLSLFIVGIYILLKFINLILVIFVNICESYNIYYMMHPESIILILFNMFCLQIFNIGVLSVIIFVISIFHKIIFYLYGKVKRTSQMVLLTFVLCISIILLLTSLLIAINEKSMLLVTVILIGALLSVLIFIISIFYKIIFYLYGKAKGTSQIILLTFTLFICGSLLLLILPFFLYIFLIYFRIRNSIIFWW